MLKKNLNIMQILRKRDENEKLINEAYAKAEK